MGNYFTSDFYMYSRKKEDDQYEEQFHLQEGNPMSRFKHEVYAYALGKKFTDMKSLYLYCGYSRVVKCISSIVDEVPYITLTFSSVEFAEEWDRCREQIPKVYVDMQWLESAFAKQWVFHVTDDTCIRTYQNFRMNSKS
jgi:hypothetical protein